MANSTNEQSQIEQAKLDLEASIDGNDRGRIVVLLTGARDKMGAEDKNALLQHGLQHAIDAGNRTMVEAVLDGINTAFRGDLNAGKDTYNFAVGYVINNDKEDMGRVVLKKAQFGFSHDSVFVSELTDLFDQKFTASANPQQEADPLEEVKSLIDTGTPQNVSDFFIRQKTAPEVLNGNRGLEPLYQNAAQYAVEENKAGILVKINEASITTFPSDPSKIYKHSLGLIGQDNKNMADALLKSAESAKRRFLMGDEAWQSVQKAYNERFTSKTAEVAAPVETTAQVAAPPKPQISPANPARRESSIEVTPLPEQKKTVQPSASAPASDAGKDAMAGMAVELGAMSQYFEALFANAGIPAADTAREFEGAMLSAIEQMPQDVNFTNQQQQQAFEIIKTFTEARAERVFDVAENKAKIDAYVAKTPGLRDAQLPSTEMFERLGMGSGNAAADESNSRIASYALLSGMDETTFLQRVGLDPAYLNELTGLEAQARRELGKIDSAALASIDLTKNLTTAMTNAFVELKAKVPVQQQNNDAAEKVAADTRTALGANTAQENTTQTYSGGLIGMQAFLKQDLGYTNIEPSGYIDGPTKAAFADLEKQAGGADEESLRQYLSQEKGIDETRIDQFFRQLNWHTTGRLGLENPFDASRIEGQNPDGASTQERAAAEAQAAVDGQKPQSTAQEQPALAATTTSIIATQPSSAETNFAGVSTDDADGYNENRAALQEILKYDLGLYKGKIDGLDGDGTQNAFAALGEKIREDYGGNLDAFLKAELPDYTRSFKENYAGYSAKYGDVMGLGVGTPAAAAVDAHTQKTALQGEAGSSGLSQSGLLRRTYNDVAQALPDTDVAARQDLAASLAAQADMRG